jgi:CheY-like chemotaxis protein
MNHSSPPHILLVEDNDEDYTTFLHLVNRSGVACHIHRCTNGDDTLDCLYGRGLYTNAPHWQPALIFLDLNLPGLDGRGLLATLKNDAQLRLIPVVIFTTSSNPKDVLECYRLGANAYQIKTIDLPKLRQEIKQTLEYWLQMVILPA